jgi:hypothetical protein
MAHYEANIVYFSYSPPPPKNLKTIQELIVVSDNTTKTQNIFVSETGVSSEIPKIQVSLDISDVALSIDRFPDEFQEIGVFDSGTGIDNILIKSYLALQDSGFGTDTQNISVLAKILDSGNSVDSSLFLRLIKILESGFGTDIQNISVLAKILDSGIGTDIQNISVLSKILDSGIGTDNMIQNLRGLILSDSGLGSDSVSSIRNSMKVLDSGIGTDNIIQNLRNLVLTDSGIGTDNIIQNLRTLNVKDFCYGNDTVGQILNDLTVSDVGLYVDTKNKIASKIELYDLAHGNDIENISVDIKLNDIINTSEQLYKESNVAHGKVTMYLEMIKPNIKIIKNETPKIFISQRGLI